MFKKAGGLAGDGSLLARRGLLVEVHVGRAETHTSQVILALVEESGAVDVRRRVHAVGSALTRKVIRASRRLGRVGRSDRAFW